MSLVDTVSAGLRLARVARAGLAVARAEDGARDLARRHLGERLGEARGLATKLGQWFEDVPTTTPVRPWSDYRDEVAAIWGPQAFAGIRIDAGAARAASLGQVFRLRDGQGRDLAVKVRHPGIVPAIDGELRVLGLMPAGGPVRRFGVDLGAYRALLRETLDGELDYRREAAAQIAYRRALAVDEGIIVAEVLAERSGEAVLTQAWEEGIDLAAAARADEALRRTWASILVRHLLRQTLDRGCIQADLHAGNLAFRVDGPAVVLYDFGCCRPVLPSRRAALGRLLHACQAGDDTRGIAALVEVGFDAERLAPIADHLPAVLRQAFAPFYARGAFDASAWCPGEAIAAALGEARWTFRAAAQADLLWFMRAWSGLLRTVRRLGATVDWHQALAEAMPTGGPADASAVRALPAAIATRATWLRIRVERDHQVTADITMPAAAVVNLVDLVDAGLAERIAAQGVDLGCLRDRLLAQGVPAGPVFTDRQDRRQVAVWLE